MCYILSFQAVSFYAYRIIRWQELYIHSAAICNQRFNYHIEQRVYDVAAVAEYKGRAKKSKRTARNRRIPEVPFIARRSYFTWKIQDLVPKLSPKSKLIYYPCNYYNIFFFLIFPIRISLRIW